MHANCAIDLILDFIPGSRLKVLLNKIMLIIKLYTYQRECMSIFTHNEKWRFHKLKSAFYSYYSTNMQCEVIDDMLKEYTRVIMGGRK